MLLPYVYALTLIILFVYATLLFVVAIYKKDNSIMDIAYGPAFIVSALALFLAALALLKVISWPSTIITACICIWGTRLCYRIYTRNAGKPEDFRYKAWRELWSKQGKAYFYIRSYVQVFLLQAFIVSIILLPLTVTYSFFTWVPTLQPVYFDLFSLCGILMFIIGFLFEAIGDYQLDLFIQTNAKKKPSVMDTGLWKYTRHPNYFGESLQWWGLALIAFGFTFSWIAFLSPLLITTLLLFVSGIPLVEKRWAGNKEWETYKQKTSVFIPWFPKQ